jgi:hypothetical protein
MPKRPPRQPKRTRLETDAEVRPALLAVLRVGAGKETACAQAGVSESSLRSWIETGRLAWQRRDGGNELDERESFFADFYDEVRKAETHTRNYVLGLIQKAADGDWKAGAWLAEKLYPKDYGYGIRVDFKVDEELSGFLTRLERNLEPSVFERVLRAANGEADRAEAAGSGEGEEGGSGGDD